MINTVNVKNTIIGEGIPKICVPIVGSTTMDILEQAKKILSFDVDLVEWRVDFFDNVMQTDAVLDTAKELRTILDTLPILFTFRRKEEGGQLSISNEAYFALNQQIASSGFVDLIDIELFSVNRTEDFQAFVTSIHNVHVKIVMSNHNFEKTVSKETIIERLCRMEALGCDISKIALMPNTSEDVLTLLSATNEMVTKYAKQPVITMSMGSLGAVSRLSGEIFGSSVTFACIEQSSAPGQIPVTHLREILNLIHNKETTC